MTYLLPCTCGREIMIEPRQAGETVHCECGRACSVPTIREIQNLRRGTVPEGPATPKSRPAWDNSQRLLAAGLLLIVLAAGVVGILYLQLPARYGGRFSPEAEARGVQRLSTAASIMYFRRVIEPGIEITEQADVQSDRSRVLIGMSSASVFAAIGLILMGIGIAGRFRPK
jgi:hypothetical protein